MAIKLAKIASPRSEQFVAVATVQLELVVRNLKDAWGYLPTFDCFLLTAYFMSICSPVCLLSVCLIVCFFHRRPRADRLPLCSFTTGRQLGHFLPSGNLPSIFVLVFTWVAVVKVNVHTIDIAHLRSEFTTTEALRYGTCSQGIS